MLKLKEKKEEKAKEVVEEKVDNVQPEEDTKNQTAEEKEEVLEVVKEEKKDKKEGYTEEDFIDLANLMNKKVDDLKEDFFLYQIKKLLNGLDKVVVRYNVPEDELEKLFKNCQTLDLNGIILSPAYLPVAKRVKGKNHLSVSVKSVVDFPFGESAFKAKLTNLKEGVKLGVTQTTVMMPSMLITEENIKIFKKQCAKIGRKGNTGVAINATDLDKEAFLKAVKVINKTKISFVTFVFGDATFDEVKTKMASVKEMELEKKVFVLANVDTAEAVMQLNKLGVDRICTPYADQIGKALFERFNITSAKLI